MWPARIADEPARAMMRMAVLASGSGTILQAILAEGLDVALVAVDRPCRATQVATEAGVEALAVRRESYGDDFDRDGYTSALTDALVGAGIDLIAMAGFGTILGASIYEHYAGRILNTHPSLLPSFPGWHAVDDALAYGVKVTGCTVHVAELEVDSGPILAQQAVPIEPGDTTASLHERIKIVERRLYIETIRSIIERGAVLPE